MQKELCMAAERGTDVRISSLPASLIKLVFLPSHLVLLHRAHPLRCPHLSIYPGFIHAKGYVSDDQTAVVGTINMDYRSLYPAFECGVYLYGCDAVGWISKGFLRYLPLCTEIGIDYCQKRSVFVRCFQCILRLFAPLCWKYIIFIFCN